MIKVEQEAVVGENEDKGFIECFPCVTSVIPFYVLPQLRLPITCVLSKHISISPAQGSKLHAQLQINVIYKLKIHLTV